MSDAPFLSYHEHPGSPFEKKAEFGIILGAGDYHIWCREDTATGSHQALFRFCIDGGFENSHPKTMLAVSELYRAMQEECDDDETQE
jgi:hypothetical protein